VPTLADAVGKMSTTAIYPGEIILMAKLADTQGQSGMSYSLEKGQVLITFPASDIISTGAVRVGDSVDIMVTMKPTGQGGNATPGQATNNPPATTQLTTTTPLTTNNLPATTQLTMQNLKVVSIGTQSAASKNGAQAAPTGGSLITFALGQQDALMLKALKDGEGLTLELVLRAAGDDQIVTTEPVTMQTIIDRYKLR
jgi:Flp pilus assembly protein CpaB